MEYSIKRSLLLLVNTRVVHDVYDQCTYCSSSLYQSMIFVLFFCFCYVRACSAYDGWTHLGKKVYNVMLIADGRVFYHKTIPSYLDNKCSSEWQFSKLRPIIHDLLAQNIPIVGFVTDNAADATKVGKMVEAEWPFILSLPCAAHTCKLFFNRNRNRKIKSSKFMYVCLVSLRYYVNRNRSATGC
jgi:hypothetical protein